MNTTDPIEYLLNSKDSNVTIDLGKSQQAMTSKLVLREATLEDVPQMAYVDMAAFHPTSVLIRKLFPLVPGTDMLDDVNLVAAKTYMSQEVQDTSQGITWLVVEEGTRIVAIGKWVFPSAAQAAGTEAPPATAWPEHMDPHLIEDFFHHLYSRRDAFYGADSKDTYCVMQWICTLPAYEHRGAASSMLRWGLNKADALGLSSWIEGTAHGTPLYKRLGWQEVEDLVVEDQGETELIKLMHRPPVAQTS